jgi:membrane-associated phospholipid phosphatase
MPLPPTAFDLWFLTAMFGLLGKRPVFDLAVQSAVRHNVLGGIWFAAVLFVYWSASERQDSRRLRLLTTLLGCIMAILLGEGLNCIFERMPPNRSPGLFVYPEYMADNPNTNCFPSMSAAVYAAVAAGIGSLSRAVGWLSWAAVVILIAIPRMYLGGHYPSDIFAGIACAWLGYWIALHLQPTYEGHVQRWLGADAPRLALTVLVFAWILQVGVEFRDAAWLRHSLDVLIKVPFDAKASSLKGMIWR